MKDPISSTGADQAKNREIIKQMGNPANLDLRDLHCSYLLTASLTPRYGESGYERRMASVEGKLAFLDDLIETKEKVYLQEADQHDKVQVSAKADHWLAVSLTTAISRATTICCGYLYLKVWIMPDESRWYKIGITDDSACRDSEQNVLPTPAFTLKLVHLPSMDHARATEAAIHQVLDERRIRGANNKELFHLKPEQLAALVEVMEQAG